MTNETSANKILLVEDEFNISKLFSFNLKRSGYDCEVAENGQEGYEKAQSFKPDLIISDIMMPEVDGFEFRKMLLENDELKSIPFVFLTAKGDEEDILKGYELEIEDYIIKTSSPKVVIAKVSAILKSLEKERGKIVGEVQKAADSMGAKVVSDEFPQFDGFDVKHWHVPFKNVPGGDFIDYIQLDDDHLAVILGDVMGKRWGAWYFAVAYAGYVRTAVRMVLDSSQNFVPNEIIKRVNDAVFNDERISEVFITLSIIVLNKKDNIALYGGAGDLPLIYKGEKVETFESKGLLLGFNKESEYENIEIKLNKDDELFLITDGITESRSKEGEQFGEERLSNLIESVNREKNSLDAVKEDFTEFTAGNFEDDVSIIAIKKT